MIKQSAQSFRFALLDFTFRSFVTPTIVRIIYVVAMIVAAIDSIIIFFLCTSPPSLLSGAYGGYGRAGHGGGGSVLLGIIVGPTCFVLQIIAARVILESAIALIRIAENTDRAQRREAIER